MSSLFEGICALIGTYDFTSNLITKEFTASVWVEAQLTYTVKDFSGHIKPNTPEVK